MKNLFMSLSAALLLSGASLSANAITFLYSVSADGGASFGPSTFKTFPSTNIGGLSSLEITPKSGFLNVTASAVDLDVDVSTALITPRPINDPATDTIVANFDFRVRIADLADGATFADLESGAPTKPFVQFSQTGQFTLSNIKEGSVSSIFDTAPFGGNFGFTNTSAQTLFLNGSPITLSFKSFDFPGAPQFDVLNGDFRGFGAITDTLAAVPEPGSVALFAGLMISGSSMFLRRRK